MACVNPQNPNCKNCNKAGLAILPVRYAVVPENVMSFLPATMGNKVTDVKLSHHRYALRTLRQGFVYVFYEKNAYGIQNAWEIYSVTPAGTVWKQLTIMSIEHKADEPSCSSSGHNIPASVITIEKPEKCGKVWIAFSEHEWSPETFKEYASNLKLRDRRMQTLIPSMWVKNKTYRHGLEATKEHIETVIEYQDSFNTLALEPGTLPIISQEDGTHIAHNLKKSSTRYPLHMRKGQSELLARKMKEIGEHPHGHYPGMVMALWDAVGITHELNGFRNDAAGWIEKYGKERELELTAMNAIEGAKLALEHRAAETARYASEAGVFIWSPDASSKRLANAQKIYGNDSMRMRHEQELCRRWETDAQQKIPSHIANQRQYYVQLNDQEWAKGMAQVDKQAAMYTTRSKEDGKSVVERREQRSQQWEKDAAKDAWPKYNAKLAHPGYENFKKNYSTFLNAADKLIDDRTDDLVAWLESRWLINAFTEFHSKNDYDCVVFEDHVGTAMMGMNSSIKGKEKIDAWIKEMKVTETNLLWRVIAQNQEEAIPEINAALKHAYGAQVPLTKAAWDIAYNDIKWNKIFDLGKKSLGLFNTNQKAKNDLTTGIRALENTRGLDKIFSSVGTRFLKPFTWAVDTVNEATLQTLLAVRSGVEPKAALALVETQIKYQTIEREDFIRRLRNNEHYLPEVAKARQAELAARWKGLRADVEIPDAKRGTFNAVRDARLALIVGLFEVFNIYKASQKLGKDPKDVKLQAQLLAAQLAASAAAVDVLSTFVKGLHELKDVAVSYQMLKLAGGGLSVYASWLGAAKDWDSYNEAKANADYRMAILYGERVAFQIVSLSLTTLTTLSYCSPLIQAFGKQFAKRTIGTFAIGAAEELVALRAALFLASIEVSIFVLAVSVVIWSFDDDALEKWCDRSAFGAKRKELKDAYKTEQKQTVAFNEALVGIL